MRERKHFVSIEHKFTRKTLFLLPEYLLETGSRDESMHMCNI